MSVLEKIKDEIIQEAFPELLDEDVKIEYKPLSDALLAGGLLSPEGFYIEVDNSLKSAPKDVNIGGIAHEIAHFVVGKQLSIKKSFWDYVLYKVSARYRTLDERNTDLTVLIRGFGEQLLSFMRYTEEKGFPYYKEDGLSIGELTILQSSKGGKNE